jgi:hypothetical protein
MNYSDELLKQKALVTQLQAPHQTNHLLHLFASVFTLGWWLIVWIVIAIINSHKRKKIAAEHGVAQ